MSNNLVPQSPQLVQAPAPDWFRDDAQVIDFRNVRRSSGSAKTWHSGLGVTTNPYTGKIDTDKIIAQCEASWPEADHTSHIDVDRMRRKLFNAIQVLRNETRIGYILDKPHVFTRSSAATVA